LAAIDLQIEQLRVKLADLTSRYTNQYPDVIAAKDQIDKLEKRRAALAAQLQNASTKADAPPETADPATAAQILQLQGQLHANQLDIANREKSISELQGKINDYQARLNAEPATEQQLDDLNRGYEQSKKDYDELLKKESDSEQATSMEQMQQGERFTEIDPAPLLLRPTFPNRLKFCGMGVGVGIALGLAVVFLLEFLDDRLHSESQIKTMLPGPVLTEIPEVRSPAAMQAAKRKLMIAWVATGFALVTILAGSAFSYLHS
jgi:polysaccharide biosynthesis transport protein